MDSPTPAAYQSANKGGEVRAVSAVMMALTVVFVSLRFLSRKLVKTRFYPEDWLILAALVRAKLLAGCSYFSKIDHSLAIRSGHVCHQHLLR